MTTDSLLFMCYRTGLTRADIEDMDIGQILDYAQEWISNMNPDKKKSGRVRKAAQTDFDRY